MPWSPESKVQKSSQASKKLWPESKWHAAAIAHAMGSPPVSGRERPVCFEISHFYTLARMDAFLLAHVVQASFLFLVFQQSIFSKDSLYSLSIP